VGGCDVTASGRRDTSWAMSRLASFPLLAFLFRVFVSSPICGGGMAAASLDAAAGEAFTSEAAIRRAERRDDILRTSLRIASLSVRGGIN